MELNDLHAMVEDQERGAWVELLDPVHGRPTGLEFLVSGPDSRVQARARLACVDELAEAADLDGRISAEARDRARLNQLARAVLDWKVSEDGKALPFSHVNILRVLRAGVWVQAQLDNAAADRRRFPGAR